MPALPRSPYFWVLFSTALVILVAGLILGFFVQGWLAWILVAVYVGFDGWLLASSYAAARAAIQEEKEKERMAPGLSPIPDSPLPQPVSLSLVICARNERAALPFMLETLQKALRKTERAGEEIDIVVVDDGSTDGTGAWMRDHFMMRAAGGTASGTPVFVSRTWPGLRLLVRKGGGKAWALNEGWRATAGEVVVTLDADTLVESGALEALRASFSADPFLAVSGGVLTPQCAPGTGWRGGLFQFFQTFEYLRSFLWRASWRRRGCLVLVSGAFGAYRRQALAAVGGYDPGSLVEDYDIVYRIHRHSGEMGLGWKVGLCGAARAVTDVPARIAQFLRQRRRWFGGFLQVLFRNRDMAGKAQYGTVGSYMIPLKAVDCLLPLYSLAASGVLVWFLATGRMWNPIILAILAGKFLYDATFHLLSARLWQRWQGDRGLLPGALLATFTEPFFFQLLRHFGALLGWVDFFRRRIDWTPQRPVVALGSVSANEGK
ncbi:Glycosyltransferase, catalytic subunit of cellulose synthase and poly-beta-1,6-N-acetylglucosamine synthase [Verrucomicrobium sp. GAS474]|uniref:glycosyltransferase n=1 Tax=Verrucomicrobium sp. GAS474 TaxID=1882831 RepID=UPI0008794CD2|nr:glycosyltransferase family 2 protein [Verrucomicrobium sp. GAS474]SDU02324.1 Glycosyltransferase, catalytic subunit of cellulose synthase and poly-beta-1,6-N-acetylglucosamine synthase [Verrucomicrobium sp. GAS474]